jgi:hypothetical protein
MSGSGKTTIGFHIINNFIKKQKPFLIFDWKKSFRPLLNADPNLMIFTIGEDKVTNLFKINITQPPKGVAPKEWINVLCDLLTESFMVSFGVHKILLETLDEAFKEWGIYQGSKNYPTWNHIKWRLEQKINKTDGRESTWLESALRIASVLTFGSFGKIVNYKGEDSMNVEDLLDKKVILELNSLGSVEKKFFSEFILTYIYKLKKAKSNLVSNQFEHAILVDEAHNIFLKSKTNFTQESVTDMIYREMREYGISLICLDQDVSKLSDTVKGNSACHIAFQQQLPQDIMDMSNMMQLFDRREFFSKLPVGSAIVKLSERYTSPFLIEVDQVDLRKDHISDKDVKNRMNAILTSRELEQGKDKEFVDDLIEDPRIKQHQEQKQTKAIVPKHALYNEEFELANAKNKAETEILMKRNKIIDPTESYKPEEIIEQNKETSQNPVIKYKFKEIPAKNNLTKVQQILYEFVLERLKLGDSIKEIELIMEKNKSKGNFTSQDIIKVINHELDQRL